MMSSARKEAVDDAPLIRMRSGNGKSGSKSRFGAPGADLIDRAGKNFPSLLALSQRESRGVLFKDRQHPLRRFVEGQALHPLRPSHASKVPVSMGRRKEQDGPLGHGGEDKDEGEWKASL